MGVGVFLCVDIHLQRWPEDKKSNCGTENEVRVERQSINSLENSSGEVAKNNYS